MTPSGSERPAVEVGIEASRPRNAAVAEGGVRGRSHGIVAWVPVATMVLVLVPLVVLTARAVTSGLPDFAVEGDMAVTELAVREAASGRRLLGPYSRFAFNHPGPLPFYLMVPGYRLAGDSFSGLLLTALLVNAACVAAAVVVAWLAGGRLWATWAGVAVASYLLYLEPDLLHSVWNPNLSLLPFLAAVLAAAAVGAGRPWALPLAACFASLALQCHVAYLLPLVAVALVTAGAWLRPGLITTTSAPRPGRGEWWRWLGVAGLLCLVLWWPVIYEQFTGVPGNLTRLARFFAQAGAGQGLGKAVEVVTSTVGAAALAATGSHGGQSWLAPVFATLLLVGAASAFFRCRRRGDRFGATLALTCVLLFAVAVVAVTRIVGTVEPYLVRWISVLAPLSLAVVLAAWGRPRRRRPLSAAVWTAIGLLTLLSSVSLARSVSFPSLGVHAGGERYRRIERLASVVAASLARDHLTTPRIGVFSHRVWDTAAGLALRLLKHGYAVGIDPAWQEMMGRGDAGPGWEADSGIVLCQPEAVHALLADGNTLEIAGDEHVAVVRVARPAIVDDVEMAAPLSVVVCSEGVYGPEAGRFRWSRGLHSTFSVPLAEGRSVDLSVIATPAATPGREQVVSLALNGVAVGTWTMRPGQGLYELTLPAPLVGATNVLRFDYSTFVVPGTTDSRELAVRFERLLFRPEGRDDGEDRPVGN